MLLINNYFYVMFIHYNLKYYYKIEIYSFLSNNKEYYDDEDDENFVNNQILINIKFGYSQNYPFRGVNNIILVLRLAIKKNFFKTIYFVWLNHNYMNILL